MKLSKSLLVVTMVTSLSAFVFNNTVNAQSDEKDDKIIADAREAKAEFIKADGLMKNLFDNSYGYVIFPNVGKGAIGIGGAAGNGAVFLLEKPIGMAKMKI